MKASRFVAEGIFLLTAVFYSASSSNFANRTEPWMVIVPMVPEDQDLRIPSGEVFTISCYAFSHSVTHFTRMAWIDPRGEEIPEQAYLRRLLMVQRSGNSIMLFIIDPQKGNSGTYTCLAEYNETLDTLNYDGVGKVEAQVNITVLDKPEMSKFQNVTVEEGKTAVLECRAKSYPTPNITIWKDNGPEYSGNEDGRIEVEYFPETDRNSVTVTIKDVNRTDEGQYYCTAEANGFYSNDTAYLEVQFAPNLTTPAHRVVMSKLNHFFGYLTCIAEANPPAVISWEFENKEIYPEPEHMSKYGRTVVSSIQIDRSNASSNCSNVCGTYKCTARNRLGSRSLEITLKETDVPEEITSVIFERVTSRSILFRFIEPSYDGGEPIIAYVVNYNTPEDYYHHKTKEWPVGSSYLLENLRPGGNYTFKFAAKNSAGIGDWKKIHYLLPGDVNDTTTEPNTLITKNVNITDYPDRYEIRWKVHDDYGMLKRYFVVTYYDDGRVKVEHQNGNTTYSF